MMFPALIFAACKRRIPLLISFQAHLASLNVNCLRRWDFYSKMPFEYFAKRSAVVLLW